MTLKKLPLEGLFLEDVAHKLNEVIDYINKVEAMFGMELPEAPPKATRDLYKEDQLKGNET